MPPDPAARSNVGKNSSNCALYPLRSPGQLHMFCLIFLVIEKYYKTLRFQA